MAPSNLPTCIINPTLARQRIDEFEKGKKPVLDTLLGNKSKDFTFTYSVPVFLELLDTLTKHSNGYSGMRVFFGSYEENLTLIFVPTITNPHDLKLTNDLNNCFIIVDNQLIGLRKPEKGKLAWDAAYKWVKQYQDKLLPALSENGKTVTGNDSFKDTSCLWYKIEIFKGGLGSPGLIQYIRDLQNDPNDPLEAIVAQFACYTNTDTYKNPDTKVTFQLNYQLTLLFELRQKSSPVSNPNPVCFGTKHHDDELRLPQAPKLKELAVLPGTEKNVVAIPEKVEQGSSDADTGFPCPPATTCNGSSLV